ENRLRPLRELLERMTQRRARLARHRAQAAGKLRGLRDRLIDQLDRLLKIRGVAVIGGRQLLAQRLEHQLHAGEYLAESVVQIVADLVPLPLDPVNDLSLEVDPVR